MTTTQNKKNGKPNTAEDVKTVKENWEDLPVPPLTFTFYDGHHRCKDKQEFHRILCSSLRALRGRLDINDMFDLILYVMDLGEEDTKPTNSLMSQMYYGKTDAPDILIKNTNKLLITYEITLGAVLLDPYTPQSRKRITKIEDEKDTFEFSEDTKEEPQEADFTTLEFVEGYHEFRTVMDEACLNDYPKEALFAAFKVLYASDQLPKGEKRFR